MIFVTVGTHHDPFDRLLRALDSLPGDELVVQYGSGARPEGAAVAEPYMPFDRMLRLFDEADKVVTHAGEGSLVCATRAGHVPLMVPRRHDLGEHVDEHQAELTRSAERLGSAIAVWDTEELAALLARAPDRGEPKPNAPAPLCDSIRAALLGAPA